MINITPRVPIKTVKDSQTTADIPVVILLQMTSVERVVEYAELESEAPWETDVRPPYDWPTRGCITFDRVNFSHGSREPLVLKNLSVVFKPREKVLVFILSCALPPGEHRA